MSISNFGVQETEENIFLSKLNTEIMEKTVILINNLDDREEFVKKLFELEKLRYNEIKNFKLSKKVKNSKIDSYDTNSIQKLNTDKILDENRINKKNEINLNIKKKIKKEKKSIFMKLQNNKDNYLENKKRNSQILSTLQRRLTEKNGNIKMGFEDPQRNSIFDFGNIYNQIKNWNCSANTFNLKSNNKIDEDNSYSSEEFSDILSASLEDYSDFEEEDEDLEISKKLDDKNKTNALVLNFLEVNNQILNSNSDRYTNIFSHFTIKNKRNNVNYEDKIKRCILTDNIQYININFNLYFSNSMILEDKIFEYKNLDEPKISTIKNNIIIQKIDVKNIHDEKLLKKIRKIKFLLLSDLYDLYSFKISKNCFISEKLPNNLEFKCLPKYNVLEIKEENNNIYIKNEFNSFGNFINLNPLNFSNKFVLSNSDLIMLNKSIGFYLTDYNNIINNLKNIIFMDLYNFNNKENLINWLALSKLYSKIKLEEKIDDMEYELIKISNNLSTKININSVKYNKYLYDLFSENFDYKIKRLAIVEYIKEYKIYKQKEYYYLFSFKNITSKNQFISEKLAIFCNNIKNLNKINLENNVDDLIVNNNELVFLMRKYNFMINYSYDINNYYLQYFNNIGKEYYSFRESLLNKDINYFKFDKYYNKDNMKIKEGLWLMIGEFNIWNNKLDDKFYQIPKNSLVLNDYFIFIVDNLIVNKYN